MNKAITAFFTSLGILKKDKVSLLLSFVPVVIGIVIYFAFGSYLYGSGLDWIENFINEKISAETWGAILYWLAIAFISVASFFIINFTFVLVVSMVASPFNDLLSERVEKIL